MQQVFAMQLAGFIAALGIVWDTLELTTARTDLLGRFFVWRVVRSRYYILTRRQTLSALFDVLLSDYPFLFLVLAHATAAITFVLVLPISRPVAAGLAAVVLLGHLCIHLRLLVGMDGADQMQTVLWTGLLVYSLNLGWITNAAAAIFICAQLLLSYFISGGAKLASQAWRSGKAIARITRTETYCSPGLSTILQRSSVSFIVGWMVIAFELFGPLALLAGRPGVLTFLAIGICFHVGIALSMGLSTFVFAFVAAYPVLYYLLVGR